MVTDSVIENSFAILLAVIGLVFQCCIGFVTMRKMHQKRNMNRHLQIVFFFTVFIASSSTIAAIVSSAYIMSSQEYPTICLNIFILSTYLFWVCILGTLILRLHMTFADSTFRMSTRKFRLFMAMLIYAVIAAITGTVVFDPDNLNGPRTIIGSISMGSFFLVFIVGSVLAVRYFVGNLNKLAKARVESIRRSSITADEIKLDEKQQRLSDLSARYLMLFVVAMTSSILFMVLAQSLGTIGQDSGTVSEAWAFVIVVPDFCINLLCIYLQFGFARDDFNRCCGCLDRWCKHKVSKRTKKAIHSHSLELQSKLVSPSSSPAALGPLDSSSIKNGIHSNGAISPMSPMSLQTKTRENTITPTVEAGAESVQ